MFYDILTLTIAIILLLLMIRYSNKRPHNKRFKLVQRYINNCKRQSGNCNLENDDQSHITVGEINHRSENCPTNHTDYHSVSCNIEPNNLNYDIPAEEISDDDDFNVAYVSDSEYCDENDSTMYVENNTANFSHQLASTFIKAGINHTQGDHILELLKNHQCFQFLPATTKTLLKTPRIALQSIKMGDGEYYHVGLAKEILTKLNRIPSSKTPNYLELDIHTDGMSIHKSTGTQMWPIQCRVNNVINDKPSIIGIYIGKKKPTNAVEFLQYFVREFQNLQRSNGIQFKDKIIPVYLRSFIADAPARAFILNHRGHNAASPCSKCTIIGRTVQRRMCSLTYNDIHRTDSNYLNATDCNHRQPNNESALKSLGFCMVTRVPFEYMHLICLGVVKKFLEAVVDSKFDYNGLDKVTAMQVSANLMLLRSYTPSEFARRPRPLDDYAKYKATEFRQLLLYSGAVVFYGCLKGDAYLHFLLLSSACRSLLVTHPNAIDLDYARVALKSYVECCEHIYGKTFVSYNVHGLLHVVEDVRALGNLNNYSAFPYEDNLTFIRKYLRKPHQLIPQIHRRLAEASRFQLPNKCNELSIQPFRRHNHGPLTQNLNCDVVQYRGLKFEHIRFEAQSKRDGCILLRDGRICDIHNVLQFPSGHYMLIVKRYLNINNFYDIPFTISSSFVGIYECSNICQNIEIISLDQILAKCFKMPLIDLDDLNAESFVMTALLSNI